MTETLSQRMQVSEPRNALERLWNKLGFFTATQRREHFAAVDAKLHEARLRRLEENGGLDPTDPNDYMTIQIRRHHQEEALKRRNREIRALTRQILASQVPNQTRHELHTPRDVQDALAQATRIYDLTIEARVPNSKEPLPGD